VEERKIEMNVLERVIAAHKEDVTSDWFTQNQRQEKREATRLLAALFAVLVIVVAVASMVASVVVR
jgi:uncharacterized membrane protein